MAPETDPNLFALCHIEQDVQSEIGDLRDLHRLRAMVERTDPDLVLHLAAQSLVQKGYTAPLDTFAVNIQGTANLLEALRSAPRTRAVLVVTTDKVYENTEDGRAFCEDDPLGGHDPYSASKAAAEIVTRSYARSFFGERKARIATARGGNVIGGGDFSAHRLVPDVWRAAETGARVELRYPDATRPWQHVLDCLNGYFLFLEELARDTPVPNTLNFAPDESDTLSVSAMVARLQLGFGVQAGWKQNRGVLSKEVRMLRLSSARATASLGWRNLLDAETAIDWTVNWYRAFSDRRDIRSTTLGQIAKFVDNT